MTDQNQPGYYSSYPPPPPPSPYGPNGWGAPAAPPRSRALGLTAMLVALPLFVLSVFASVIAGTMSGPYSTHSSTGFSFNTSQLTPEQAQSFAPVGVLIGAQFLIGTVLGILALVLGIVAVATKRGRPFGVVAIVVAALAPIVSFVVYAVSIAATLAPA